MSVVVRRLQALLGKDLTIAGDQTYTGAVDFSGTNSLTLPSGTFSAVVADAPSGGNASPTAPLTATYTKVGNLVTLHIAFENIDTTGLSAINTIYIRGLPFIPASVVGNSWDIGRCATQSVTFSAPPIPVLLDNTSAIRFVLPVSGVSTFSYLTVAGLASGSADIYLNITYEV